jgi:hypothetical protein
VKVAPSPHGGRPRPSSDSIAALVGSLKEFKRRYNGQWLIERHGFQKPSQAKIEFVAWSKD